MNEPINDLREVRRVHETKHKDVVNEAITQGWKLHKTYTYDYGHPTISDQTLYYVMIWDSPGTIWDINDSAVLGQIEKQKWAAGATKLRSQVT